MHDVLGFERYGAHGSDLGAGECSLLAQAHPAAVVGLHLLAVADPPRVDPAGLTDDERAYLDAEQAWSDAERGYSHQQQTRPLTLAQGLSDSPSGLLAWMLEKYRAWSDGGPAGRFGDDFLLTQASLYWFTGTISTSFRPYLLRARPRDHPACRARRRADRDRALPPRSRRSTAAQLGRADLPPHALHHDASRRPLRRPRGTRPARRRHHAFFAALA